MSPLLDLKEKGSFSLTFFPLLFSWNKPLVWHVNGRWSWLEGKEKMKLESRDHNGDFQASRVMLANSKKRSTCRSYMFAYQVTVNNVKWNKKIWWCASPSSTDGNREAKQLKPLLVWTVASHIWKVDSCVEGKIRVWRRDGPTFKNHVLSSVLLAAGYVLLLWRSDPEGVLFDSGSLKGTRYSSLEGQEQEYGCEIQTSCECAVFVWIAVVGFCRDRRPPPWVLREISLQAWNRATSDLHLLYFHYFSLKSNSSYIILLVFILALLLGKWK